MNVLTRCGMRVRRLQAHPPGRDYHIVAYSSIDIVVQAEAGYAVVVGVEGPFGIFAENRAEGVDEWFPDVGPVPAGPGRDADGHADGSRCQVGVLDLQGVHSGGSERYALSGVGSQGHPARAAWMA